MLTTIFIVYLVALIAASALGALAVTRITEKPIRIGLGDLAESSANTFTTAPVSVAAVPSISLTRGQQKGIGLEVMKVVSELDPPDIEDDQNNDMVAELVKGAAPTALLGITNQRVIWRRKSENRNNFTTSGHANAYVEVTKSDDMTDGDGNGELVFDNEIHLSIKGLGNAGVNAVTGYVLAHLIEFTAEEAIFEVLEQAE